MTPNETLSVSDLVSITTTLRLHGEEGTTSAPPDSCHNAAADMTVCLLQLRADRRRLIPLRYDDVRGEKRPGQTEPPRGCLSAKIGVKINRDGPRASSKGRQGAVRCVREADRVTLCAGEIESGFN